MGEMSSGAANPYGHNDGFSGNASSATAVDFSSYRDQFVTIVVDGTPVDAGSSTPYVRWTWRPNNTTTLDEDDCALGAGNCADMLPWGARTSERVPRDNTFLIYRCYNSARFRVIVK